MNYTALSLAQTPPLSVPLRYFVTAPLFLLLAGVILLFSGPEAMTSRWNPEILAITHLLVLGFVAMVMFGAMQQLLPVLVGVPVVCSLQVSRIVHLLLSLGVLALAFGLLWDLYLMLTWGAIMLAGAVLLFAAVAFISLFRSTSQHATAMAMKLALAGLVVTALLGFLLALGHAGHITLQRHLTDIHLLWGLLAWVGLLLIGVAFQVVPMFQLTPNYPSAVARYLAPVLFLLLVLWSCLSWWNGAASGLLDGMTASALAIGYLLFAVITLNLQRKRRRRLPDTTLGFWRLAMVNLLLALVVWALSRYVDVPVSPLILGVLFVMGFIISAIVGMLFKIIPFLVWLHLNNRLQSAGQWQGKVPNMKQIITEQQTRRQYNLFVVMLIMLLCASLLPEWFIHLAAVLVIATALLLLWHILSALQIYQRVVEEMEKAAASEM
jgi:hypothetical protein